MTLFRFTVWCPLPRGVKPTGFRATLILMSLMDAESDHSDANGLPVDPYWHVQTGQ